MMPPHIGKTGGESSVRQSNDGMLGAMPVPRLVVTMSVSYTHLTLPTILRV